MSRAPGAGLPAEVLSHSQVDRSTSRLFDVTDYESALAAAGVGVWSWTIATNALRWSAEVSVLFGEAPEEFTGQLEDFQARVHPDDVAAVTEAIERAIEARAQDYVMDYRVRRPDGSIRWLGARGRVVVDDDGNPLRMTGAALDITERRLELERLSRSEDQYRLFTELASDYIYVVDTTQPTLAPTIVAGSFERTTGYTPGEVAELGGWIQVMHPEDRVSVGPLVEELHRGRPFINEYRILAKGGKIRWLRDRALPTLDPETGALIRITGGVQDITERKLLEHQLYHAQKMESLAHLAGAVAHDLNNLLTVMFTTSSILDREVTSDSGKETLAGLRHVTRRAADLTRSLLGFSRRQPSERRVVSLSDLLDRAATVMRHALGERIELSVTHESRACVAIDESQLDLALLNLATNARDAMSGTGVLTVRTRRVELAADDRNRLHELAPGGYGVIEVEDTGCGIENEKIQHVFEPFYTTKEPGKGVGLGLATVHGVIRQHSGAISVSSTPGQGSRFTLYLPESSGDAEQIVYAETMRAVGGTERILVVEDDPMVRRITIRALRELGYTVTDASSAEEALPRAADVDLIATDVRLPGMSGTELAEKLRADASPARVLLFSGYVEDPEHRRVVESGRYVFLQKPFTPEGLARSVREALGDGDS